MNADLNDKHILNIGEHESYHTR